MNWEFKIEILIEKNEAEFPIWCVTVIIHNLQ